MSQRRASLLFCGSKVSIQKVVEMADRSKSTSLRLEIGVKYAHPVYESRVSTRKPVRSRPRGNTAGLRHRFRRGSGAMAARRRRGEEESPPPTTCNALDARPQGKF